MLTSFYRLLGSAENEFVVKGDGSKGLNGYKSWLPGYLVLYDGSQNTFIRLCKNKKLFFGGYLLAIV